jgi:hypothetical protein
MWKVNIVYVNTEDNCVMYLNVHESGSEGLVYVSVNRKYNYNCNCNGEILGIGDMCIIKF